MGDGKEGGARRRVEWDWGRKKDGGMLAKNKDKGREVYKRRGGWQINEMGEKAGAGGGKAEMRRGREEGDAEEKRKKGMTSPPVEREDNCECLEMLRWTEAISFTSTDLRVCLPPPIH